MAMRERQLFVSATSVVVALLLLGLAPATAQERSTAAYQPYTFAAPGGISQGGGTTLHLGGGIEMLAWKGLGVAFEGGYLGPLSEGFQSGIGVVSANAIYQFGQPQRRKVTPFVTGGYSLAFRDETANAINVGGGVNYWLTDGVALRVEFRDHIPFEEGLSDLHVWGARVGFTWRR
jgi:opacity protein-like surface antigen